MYVPTSYDVFLSMFGEKYDGMSENEGIDESVMAVDKKISSRSVPDLIWELHSHG